MDNEFGLKELYDLTLKTTYPIELEDRVFEEGEVIARFDKIQIANFREVTSRVSANGGAGNKVRVVWEDPKEIQLSFSQGIFSRKQLALLSNSNLIKIDKAKIPISVHETLESDENGIVQLKYGSPKKIFVYDGKTYKKMNFFFKNEQKGTLDLRVPFKEVEIDYEYDYQNGGSIITIGQKMIKGFLSLEGKTRVKDDITGETHTAILRIPRLKLVSDLTMRLGREASPIMANFDAIGYPEGERRDEIIMEMIFLNDDIDADM